ncbi:MAG: BMP family ABC transporter substrate-binding protein, partial [Clostridia bacterium]|nr:BMP family ABC transporter substrate-binding protein [Clostridia bacterium]
SVVLSGINLDVAAEGTVEAINDAIAKLKNGTLKVFAADTFTVGGAAVEHALVFDGYFHESEAISAPSFDLRIDGITLLNEKY